MCKTHLKNFGITYSMRHPRGISRDEHKCNNCRKYEKEKKICEFCRDKGIKLMRGIHDAVNIHIGKTPQYPKDLKFTQKYIVRAVQNAR